MTTRTLSIFIFTFGLLFDLKSQTQSDKNSADKICESISLYFKDPNIYCIYDKIIFVDNTKNDSSIVFAVGKIDIKGTSTQYVDIFASKELKSFRRITRDTLLTADCVPCDDPRDFLGIKIQKNNKSAQVIINCSYFYNRHQKAGTIYRSFVYDILFSPTTVQRNFDKEFKLRRTSVGKIDDK